MDLKKEKNEATKKKGMALSDDALANVTGGNDEYFIVIVEHSDHFTAIPLTSLDRAKRCAHAFAIAGTTIVMTMKEYQDWLSGKIIQKMDSTITYISK